jgi:Holliday junction resolvasome RuvABC endonuclease subunit
MLTMPANASSIATLCGIDPGTNTLGVAFIAFDVVTLQIVHSQAFTLKGEKLGRNSWITEAHGDKLGRITALKEELVKLFHYVQPMEFASEAPFYNRLHPGAYGPLVEVISAVTQAVMQYDVWKILHMIDPSTVKKAVGIVGKIPKGEAKTYMRRHVVPLAGTLRYAGHIPIERLDEHSIDALAVAYCHYGRLLERLCLKP